MFGIKRQDIKELERAKKILEEQRQKTSILLERLEIEKQIEQEKQNANGVIERLKDRAGLLQDRPNRKEKKGGNYYG